MGVSFFIRDQQVKRPETSFSTPPSVAFQAFIFATILRRRLFAAAGSRLQGIASSDLSDRRRKTASLHPIWNFPDRNRVDGTTSSRQSRVLAYQPRPRDFNARGVASSEEIARQRHL